MNELTPRQIKALPALSATPNMAQGCKDAGISRKTFYEWLKNPVFAEELKSQRNILMDEAFDHIKTAVTEASSVLVALLKTENESLRLRAANHIIDQAWKVRGMAELEKRLEAIERAQREKEDPPGKQDR
jgi:hypothetical protein